MEHKVKHKNSTKICIPKTPPYWWQLGSLLLFLFFF